MFGTKFQGTAALVAILYILISHVVPLISGKIFNQGPWKYWKSPTSVILSWIIDFNSWDIFG